MAPGNDMRATNITIPLGLTGQWQWVQTVSEDRKSGTFSSKGFGLDQFYPAATGLLFEDSPGQRLTSGGTDDANSPMIANDTFDTYLMFMPNLPNAHWVPMKKVHWNWFGDARKSSGWSLLSSGAAPTTVSNQVDFPTWEKNHLTDFK